MNFDNILKGNLTNMKKKNDDLFGGMLNKSFGLSSNGMKSQSIQSNFGLKGLGMTQTKGASMTMQSNWANMSTPQRAAMRRTHVDSDGDGVPNKWDCQPFNKMKQDTDIDINSIKLGSKKIGSWKLVGNNEEELVYRNKYGDLMLSYLDAPDSYYVALDDNFNNTVIEKNFNNLNDAEKYMKQIIVNYNN